MPEPSTPPRERITSRGNALVKFMRAIRDGRDDTSIFVEGVRLCEEAAAQTDLHITHVLHTPRLLDNARGRELLARLETRGGVSISEATQEVFASIADTRTNQGVALLAARPATNESRLDAIARTAGAALIVVLHGVTNPANAGAILRAAEAAGAGGAITSIGTCDLFNPKALRGAMGSTFRLPLWTKATDAEIAAWCARRGVELFALDARATRTHTEVDWAQPAALVVGAEGAGFGTSETLGSALRIPMKPPVESLNVAVALAVVLYEAARQRGFAF